MLTGHKKYLLILMLLFSSWGFSANDYIKPNILHQIIEAVVMDNVNVRDVLIYYRIKGEKYFKYEPMYLEFNNYQFEIPFDEVGPYGIEYYILATDDANNIASLPDFNPQDNSYFIEYIRFSETSAPDVLLMQPDDGAVYEDGNQMVIHGQPASKMTGHPAVTLGLPAMQGTNHGTLGWHCQHRASLNVVVHIRCF